MAGSKNSKLNRLCQKAIDKSETNISIQLLYLIKVAVFLLVASLILLIRFTNMEVIKLSIISKSSQAFNVFQEYSVQDYSRNIALYQAVVKRIGEDRLKVLDSGGRLEEVRKVLPALLQSSEKELVEEKASVFVRTYNSVSRVTLFDWKVILVIFSSFWLPELVLLIKGLLLGNMRRKEVIKLENIFELLGSISGFKTINIIEEMCKSSKTYKKQLVSCMEHFKTEKEAALETLKTAVKHGRFGRLVDILRIYAMTDKRLAVQILERNRLEKEEDILLMAEEDIDLVDLIAFISIVPILLQLANLLMKPMLGVIYEAFKFI